MVISGEELRKITQTLQSSGVQGPQLPKADLSNLYGGGNANVVNFGDKLTVNVEGRTAFSPLNRLPEVRTKIGYTLLNKEFEPDLGKMALTVTPYTGVSYNPKEVAAPLIGGSVAIQHEKTGARLSVDGSFSSSGTGPVGYLGSPSTPNTTIAAGFSIPF